MVERGYGLGIITNGSQKSQELKISKLNLSRWVKVVAISEVVGYKKPQREIFQWASDRLNVKAEECLFVGDNYDVDIVGANLAGMSSLYYTKELKCLENQKSISNLADLFKYL